MLGVRDQDSICAISTPPGVGGIIVIRVSGSKALAYTKVLASFLPEKIESHRIYYGVICEMDSKQKIDELLISYFEEGRSFTGEEVVEISCHGNPIVAHSILQNLIQAGCRTADRGEFTFRAFMNGRVDLVQAESVLAIIESQSKKASQLALAQLQGGVSHEISDIENKIIRLLAHLEVDIDFSEEGIEIIERGEIEKRLSDIFSTLGNLVNSFELGKRAYSGFKVVFAGQPNVGKSSLLNALLKEDRAIVSEIPGTTRDVIQEQIHIDGVSVLFLDTAGLRETTDIVEKLGVDRTRRSLNEADLIFLVFDVASPRFEEVFSEIDLKENLDKLVFVGNKVDSLKNRELDIQNVNSQFYDYVCKNYNDSKLFMDKFEKCAIYLSSFDTDSSHLLINQVKRILKPVLFADEVMITQVRHYEGLKAGLRCIISASSLTTQGVGYEFIALELKDALLSIQEVIGKRFDDEILDKIFKEFCIGK